jgi:hypothetical protein
MAETAYNFVWQAEGGEKYNSHISTVIKNSKSFEEIHKYSNLLKVDFEISVCS